ncbi:hypothetical protein GCM10027176_51020 [Actinoallomurus bryophytorum]
MKGRLRYAPQMLDQRLAYCEQVRIAPRSDCTALETRRTGHGRVAPVGMVDTGDPGLKKGLWRSVRCRVWHPRRFQRPWYVYRAQYSSSGRSGPPTLWRWRSTWA